MTTYDGAFFLRDKEDEIGCQNLNMKKKLRKYLKLSIVNRNKEDYRVLKLAIKNVFNHLCKQDFYYETNSSKIFETIYIRKTNKKIFQISAIYYMDQKKYIIIKNRYINTMRKTTS